MNALISTHCACHACSARLRKDALTASQQVAAVLRKLIGKKPVEFFYAISVDVKLRPIGRPTRVSQGGVSSCLVEPREVFREAIRKRANGIVVGHNHPSGDPAPSDQDCLLTRRLVSAGEVLGIPVLDHVIVGGVAWFSFADAGLLRRPDARP